MNEKTSLLHVIIHTFDILSRLKYRRSRHCVSFAVLTLLIEKLYCTGMVKNQKVAQGGSPFRPFACILCLFLSTFCLDRADARRVDIGIGAGIQSYPSSLDPDQGLAHNPIIYPSVDLHVHLIDGVAVTGYGSRIKTLNTLAGLIWCYQYVELYTLGFGVDYNFGTARRPLKLGAQALTGFSDYTAGGLQHETAHGYGLRFYVCTMQPLMTFVSWGTRIGVQRLWAQVLSQGADSYLDSFHVDVIGYISL